MYDCLYTTRNCRILIKVFYLLENCYFDSKYDFIRWYFGQKCHFSNKIYISCGINSLEKSSNFLRKGVNLAVNFGKMTIGIRSNLIVSLKKMTIRFISIFSLSVFHWYKRKSCRNTNIEGYFHFSSKWQLVLCQLFRYVCFTGISENLAETPILKDIFIFLANGHCFQKL